MKKRILSLLLALCMVIGLLPMIALAEDTQIAGTLKQFSIVVDDAKQTGEGLTWTSNLDRPYYALTATNGQSVTWGGDANEGNYNIKVEQNANGLEVTLKNAYLKTTASYLYTLRIRYEGKVTIYLIGDNKLESGTVNSPARIYVNATEGATITGTGKLTANGDGFQASGKGGDVNGDGTEDECYKYGSVIEADCDLTIKDVTLDLDQVCSNSTNPWAGHGIRCSGDVTIDNANVDIYAQYGKGIHMGTMFSTYATAGNVIIKNGAKVKIDSKAQGIGLGTGSITIDGANNTSVEIKSNTNAFNKTPVMQNASAEASANKDGTGAAAFAAEAGTAPASKAYLYFKTLHVCYTAADDHDCTTVETCDGCGQPIGTALTHVAEADDGDCTTAVYCANTGCEHVMTPALAAHVAEADDGDCTTDRMCTNTGCTKPAIEGADEHTPENRTSCDVAANCTVCGKPALVAGQHSGGTATCIKKAECEECGEEYGDFAAHTGGTATCKDKAVCTVCSQPYGELSTEHVPAADDKDCTTAVACTLCGGEAVAAKTHAFTNSQDTSCDNVGCEHTRVVEPKPDFKISFAIASGGGGIPSADGKSTLTMKAGDATKYYTTGNYDTSAPKDYFCKELTDAAKIAAGEWNIKIEYEADGIPTVTLKGAFIQNKGGLQFGGWYAPYEGPTKLIIEEDSIINSGYGYNSTLRFTTKGQNDDVIVTSVNNAKLTLISNTLAKDEGAIKASGNLILDNANIEAILTEYNGIANGICVVGGNLTIKGGTLKIHAWDDPNKTGTHAEGEDPNYWLNASAAYAGFKVSKDAANEAKAGNVTIEGGANVYLAISVCSDAADAEKRLIASDGVFTIKDSTVEMGLIGKCVSGAKLFSVKPTLEFTNGYTVTATKTTKPSVTTTNHELDKWARTVVMTPKADKIVDWASTTSIGSITYFKVVPGGNGSSGTGSGSGSSSPNTGDISILLTAAVALSSAVGFAGVTVLRKKKG